MRDADHRTWNIFRRRHAHGLCCAVAADAPLPPFVLTGEWTFGFQFTRGDAPVPGFSPVAAEIGARFNGFYLFLAFSRSVAAAAGAGFRAADGDGLEPNGPLAHSPSPAMGSA